jgi:LysM repeat protein
MLDFVKTNKIAFTLFLFFMSLTLVSSFYFKNNLRNEDITVKAFESVTKSLPVATSSNQNLIEASKAKSQTKKETKLIENEDNSQVVIATTTPMVTGDTYKLAVGDKYYEINLPANQTVYNLMMALKKRGDFDFSGKDSSGLGFFVESINGVKNNSFKNTFWFYYINGKSASVGISNYVLKPNNLISWKYEKPQF